MPFSYEEGLQRILWDRVFTEAQRLELEEYEVWLRVNRHVKVSTRYNYLMGLKQFAVHYNNGSQRPLGEMTKQDVYGYLGGRNEGTMKNDIVSLKSFLNFKDKKDVYKSFKSYRPTLKIPHILTPKEVEGLIKACRDDYERAFLELTWESAGRLGEVLALKVGDMTFLDYGVKVTLRGKTGERSLTLIICVGSLQRFVNNHPNRDQLDKPVFYSPQNPKLAISQQGARKKLRKIAQRAQIKKRIYPHLLRHTRGTELARPPYNFTERQLMLWMGHNDPGMVKVYIHLSGRDVDNKYVSVVRKGLPPTVPVEPDVTEKVCPRCEQSNISTNKFCSKCGLCLDEKAALELSEEERKRMRFNDLLWDTLRGDLEKQEKFMRFLKEL